MIHVVVLSDTHIRRGAARRLPPAAYPHLDAADVILHAGDVLVPEVLDELGGFAPVHAVLGNNDAELAGVLPETLEKTLAGVRVAMIHDSGASRGRETRMRRRFPHAAVVVFGHSHIPWNGSGHIPWNAAGAEGQILFNPGSPTERRAQPHHTLGTIDLDDSRVTEAAVHVLG